MIIKKAAISQDILQRIEKQMSATLNQKHPYIGLLRSSSLLWACSTLVIHMATTERPTQRRTIILSVCPYPHTQRRWSWKQNFLQQQVIAHVNYIRLRKLKSKCSNTVKEMQASTNLKFKEAGCSNIILSLSSEVLSMELPLFINRQYYEAPIANLQALETFFDAKSNEIETSLKKEKSIPSVLLKEVQESSLDDKVQEANPSIIKLLMLFFLASCAHGTHFKAPLCCKATKDIRDAKASVARAKGKYIHKSQACCKLRFSCLHNKKESSKWGPKAKDENKAKTRKKRDVKESPSKSEGESDSDQKPKKGRKA